MALDKPSNGEDLERFSQSTAWQRLLLMSHASRLSYDNPDFFVSGAPDAYQELQAGVRALHSEQDHQAYLCRFPARSHWLAKQVASLSDFDLTCLDYEAWASQLNAKSLSLVYAEEHPSRLASAFAHTLIKVYRPPHEPYYVNFSITPHKPLSSLVGKAPAQMTIAPFDDKQKHYLLKDGCDLREFALDLPQKDIDQIVRHLWEVKDLTRPYRLLDNNCASEILRLVDSNPKFDLVAQAGRVVAPNEAVKVLKNNRLLAGQALTPSYQTLTHNHPPKTQIGLFRPMSVPYNSIPCLKWVSQAIQCWQVHYTALP